jgi:hypothetical protein
MFDLFFLSYTESNAEQNWSSLIARFPQAKRLHGVCGVHRAHQLLAECSETDFYFVIDGDNLIHSEFSFEVPFKPEHRSLYVWRARNPVNHLIYGFGGIKLYNKSLFKNKTSIGADVATTIAPHYVPVMIEASSTLFNATPLEAWRGAFRECAKLTQNVITNPQDTASSERLQTWLSVGSTEKNGSWCLLGAQQGHEFAKSTLTSGGSLVAINDFHWLQNEFLKNQHLTQITTDSSSPLGLYS